MTLNEIIKFANIKDVPDMISVSKKVWKDTNCIDDSKTKLLNEHIKHISSICI